MQDSSAPGARPHVAIFVDGIAFWTTGPGARRCASRVRKQAKRIGLRPHAIYSWNPTGAGFFVSLGPAWHRPIDLVARAAGREPKDVLSLIEIAELVRARITRLDIAIDFLGLPAGLARDLAFPSSIGSDSDAHDGLVRLRGRTRRPGSSRPGDAAVYARTRRSSRNMAVYSDRPSKLDPAGPPVLHVDVVRLRGNHVPAELREPRTIRHLMSMFQEHVLLRLVAKHVHVRADSAQRSHRARGGLPHDEHDHDRA